MSSDHALRVLQQLMAACRDAELGYQLSAAEVSDPDLARIFGEYAAQRAKFVFELQQRIRTLRGDPEPGLAGTLGGSLHRAWIDLEAALRADELHTVLTECERGEGLSVAAYRLALQEHDIDEQTRRLIQQQYESVQAAHDRVRQLRDSAPYAHR